MKKTDKLVIRRNPSMLIFADSFVGFKLIEWLIHNFSKDLSLVVVYEKNKIYQTCLKNNINTYIYKNTNDFLEFLELNDLNFDLGFLIWWPKIIKKQIINSTKGGFINTHPSYLPNNRGKHFSFWSIVEECKFGVTLHYVEEGIDSGGIIEQKEIPYTWEDTGKTLYEKAKIEIINLFKISYPKIRQFNFKSTPQDLSKGSFHLSSEINEASKLSLDESIKVRKLLNLLRAKTFEGLSGCSFEDDGIEYQIQVKIKKK